MQATCEWRTNVAVVAYKGNATMDTPHLRNQGPPSDPCFYPDTIIESAIETVVDNWSLTFGPK
jgi:hypothetical protein